MAVKEILIDTNAYAAFKRGVPESIGILQAVSLIGISTVVLGELLGGFVVGGRESRNRQELKDFLDSPKVRLFFIDGVTAETYA